MISSTRLQINNREKNTEKDKTTKVESNWCTFFRTTLNREKKQLGNMNNDITWITNRGKQDRRQDKARFRKQDISVNKTTEKVKGKKV